jgi:broad specificity phosphatase PhoE
MPGSVVILRHAQSEWNALGLWQGQADPPLSSAGRRQAAAAAVRISEQSGYEGFDLVVSSDLSRAWETAVILARGLNLAVAPDREAGLREFDAGEWSGHTLTDIERRWPGMVERFTHGAVDAPPGGEGRVAFDKRVAEATARIGTLADRVGARSVLVVTHGGVIGSVARSAGVPRRHTGHLAGFTGELTPRGIIPGDPVDFLQSAELAIETA